MSSFAFSIPLFDVLPICSPWATNCPTVELRLGLEVDVVGLPAAAVVEVDAVLAATCREDLVDDAVRRREHGLAFADVVAVVVALGQVDAVLVGPVAVRVVGVRVVRVGRRLPDLPARDGHLEERSRSRRLSVRRGRQNTDRGRRDDECRPPDVARCRHGRSPSGRLRGAPPHPYNRRGRDSLRAFVAGAACAESHPRQLSSRWQPISSCGPAPSWVVKMSLRPWTPSSARGRRQWSTSTGSRESGSPRS